MEILINNRTVFTAPEVITNLISLQESLETTLGLNRLDYYLICNGKRVSIPLVPGTRIHIVPRLCGGKGGFGSMLRAIGAQIEKTTNREACRDLSGRRLRDINEEQRLKNWIAAQAEREKETAARRQKKLERLCEQPRHEFKDEEYDKERSALPENVEDAVTQGFEAVAAASTSGSQKRRKANDIGSGVTAKKKRKLWIDEDLGSSDEASNDSSNEDKETDGRTSDERSKDLNEVET